MNTTANDKSGKALNDQQKATDKAINEKLKGEQQADKLDPAVANNNGNRDRQTDTAQKKTGGGNQKNPGM